MKVPRWLRADGGAQTLGVESRAESTAKSPYDDPTVNLQMSGELNPDAIHAALREMENPSVVAIREGWGHARALGHMCLPPDVYPDGWGPDSMYGCPECSCPWQSKGVRNLSNSYRWYGFGAKMIYGPKQWVYAGAPDARYRDVDGSPICPISTQQGFYDWRDPSESLYEVLNRIGTLMHDIHTLMHIAGQAKVMDFSQPVGPVVNTKDVDWSKFGSANGTGRGPYGRHSIPTDDAEGGA